MGSYKTAWVWKLGFWKDDGNLRSIQLALEQHRFELQGPTYMHFFIQQAHTVAVHTPQVVEVIDGKPWMQKAKCTYVWIFHCAGVGTPNLHVVERSTAIA